MDKLEKDSDYSCVGIADNNAIVYTYIFYIFFNDKIVFLNTFEILGWNLEIFAKMQKIEISYTILNMTSPLIKSHIILVEGFSYGLSEDIVKLGYAY